MREVWTTGPIGPSLSRYTPARKINHHHHPELQGSAENISLIPFDIHTIESLYGSLLYRSFREHFCLYIEDAGLCINQPTGVRKASLGAANLPKPDVMTWLGHRGRVGLIRNEL